MKANRLWEKSIKTKNIIYAGYVDQEKLSYLLEMSDVGLLPYDKVEDFTLSIPNKVGEYLSCGLHILTSLKGEISKFFDNSFDLFKIVSDLASKYIDKSGFGKILNNNLRNEI